MPHIAKGSDSLSLKLPARLPPLSRVLVATGVMLAHWNERRQTRKAMSRLDSRLLADIGLTDDLRIQECDKPFWRD